MTDSPSLPNRDELPEVLDLVRAEARRFLAEIDERPVRMPNAEAVAESFDGALPETGPGAVAALRELFERGADGWINSAGPRFYHFVMGGGTPAAVGAEQIVPVFDQVASAWVTSPLAVQLEALSMRWLRELFGLPGTGGGVMTTGAMMANFNGLAAGRQWCGEQQGVDVTEVGVAPIADLAVLSSGHIHATCHKVLGMLGIGRQAIQCFTADDIGNLDLSAFERALADRAREKKPTIVVANAGEVNAGVFDPIAEMVDLAKEYGAWAHVDGAFGLFAAVSPRTEHLTAGVERANSVTVDGHKWLNVPYDCGFAFVDDAGLWLRSFKLDADYLPDPNDPRPTPSFLCAESSRRARSLSVWATLRAYGRAGIRNNIERNLDQAQRLAKLVDESPELERLAEVPLNIVCFRFNPGGRTDEELDELNRQLGERILTDGRVYTGTTRYRGRVALRPAIVNWRTRDEDIRTFVDVVRELGRSL
jgi:glutamate/tyrosine decarboxylase-like PLP-dependent enzyme